MAVTRLVRKAKKNRTVSKKRIANIKRLTSKPVIKNVDIEQIKEEFANMKSKAAPKAKAPVKEAPKAEVVEATPQAEVAEAPKVEEKKPAKAAPKAKKKDSESAE